MKFFKSWPVRLALFLAGFLALNCLAEFLFLKPSRDATVVMYDMKRAENIDVAFVGNSLAGRHVDTEIMKETLGADCFDLAISSALSLTTYAMTEEMYRYHSPQTIIWIHDPSYGKEPLVVEAGLWPYLSGWKSKLAYTLKSAGLYGAYLDRFFPWRQDPPNSVKEILDNIEIKMDLDAYYEKSVKVYRSKRGNAEWNYNGRGYRSVMRERDKKKFHNVLNRKPALKEDLDLSAEKDVLLNMKRLCEKNGGKLIVLSHPAFPQILLGDQNVIRVMDDMTRFCQENGVPYLDMARAKPELLPEDLKSYYYDAWHMTKDGAEIYSRALAKVLKEYLDGQNVSGYFYTPEEYASSKNYILNGWYVEKTKDGQITYTADCIYGAGVEPQYQFSAVDAGGNEILLRQFSEERKFTCPQKDMEGKKICVTIRNAVDLEQAYVIAIKK